MLGSILTTHVVRGSVYSGCLRTTTYHGLSHTTQASGWLQLLFLDLVYVSCMRGNLLMSVHQRSSLLSDALPSHTNWIIIKISDGASRCREDIWVLDATAVSLDHVQGIISRLLKSLRCLRGSLSRVRVLLIWQHDRLRACQHRGWWLRSLVRALLAQRMRWLLSFFLGNVVGVIWEIREYGIYRVGQTI